MTAVLGRIIAIVTCIVGAPIHFCLCALIRMSDAGPVLYRSRRLGRNGVPFACLKYRTMKKGAPPLVTAGFKMVVTRSDARVTPLGRWLRCGIDELPQIWNIARGEMAWVGPRPDEAWMFPYYGPLSKSRFSVLPGITGLAQVMNSRELTTEEGFAIDLWYVYHRTFWLDAWIVFVTPLFMAGWHSLTCGRLRRLRSDCEFERLRQGCEMELSVAAGCWRDHQ